MKTLIGSSIIAALLWGAGILELRAQGTAFTYQGALTERGSPAHGSYEFRFLLYDLSSGGSIVGNVAAPILAVSNGLFTARLDYGVNAFTGAERWLEIRVRTNSGTGVFTTLVPRQPLTATPYAMLAARVPNGAITSASLASEAVGSGQLADFLELGSPSLSGGLDVFGSGAGATAVRLDGSGNAVIVYADDGAESGRFSGQSYGLLELRDNNGRQVGARLTGNPNNGGSLSLNNSNGINRATLAGDNSGGVLTLYQGDSGVGAILDGNDIAGAGRLELRNTNSSIRALVEGGPSVGRIRLYKDDGLEGALLYGMDASTRGGALALRMADGGNGLLANGGTNAASIELYNNNVRSIHVQASEGSGAGGQILMYNGAGTSATVEIDAQVGSGGGAYIGLRNSSGSRTIELDTSDGSVKGQVIEITGGADFSENFDISGDAHEPGMIVCIDPTNPGRLALSSTPYDRKVAGIISGAGGVRPGMLMSQRGSLADGKHPVALTGRVYCWVDADANGPIEPGDMLTTSNLPGHGMKVTDPARASGAVIGKAMTSLAQGKGLVLVLVNLQ